MQTGGELAKELHALVFGEKLENVISNALTSCTTKRAGCVRLRTFGRCVLMIVYLW